MTAIGKNLQAFGIGVASHNRENPTHPPANGIGVSSFDLDRLDFEDGEELWSGIIITVDGGTSGNFRVLCDFEEKNTDLKIVQGKKIFTV
jgi:hypothetical protein